MKIYINKEWDDLILVEAGKVAPMSLGSVLGSPEDTEEVLADPFELWLVASIHAETEDGITYQEAIDRGIYQRVTPEQLASGEVPERKRSKFDYFYIKAGDVVDVVDTVEGVDYAHSFYKVTVGDNPAIHYLLFAEVEDVD